MSSTDNDTKTTPSAVQASAAVTAINELWEGAGPPLPSPVPLWDTEQLLAACGAAVRRYCPQARGRARTLATAKVLSAVVSYTRVFHPSTPWLLDPTITCPDTARLAWRREGQAEVLVDLVRNPGPRAALLDASTEASARDAIAGGASAVRAVDLSAPRTSHVLLAGSSSWQPWQAGIGLSLAPTSWEVA